MYKCASVTWTEFSHLLMNDGGLATLIIFSTFNTFLISGLILWGYRRAVTKIISQQEPPNEAGVGRVTNNTLRASSLEYRPRLFGLSSSDLFNLAISTNRRRFIIALVSVIVLSSTVTAILCVANHFLGMEKPDLSGLSGIGIYWCLFTFLYIPLAFLSLSLRAFRILFAYSYVIPIMVVASLYNGAVVGGGFLTIWFLWWALGRHGMRVTVPLLWLWCVVWMVSFPVLAAFSEGAICTGIPKSATPYFFWPSFLLAGWLSWRWWGRHLVGLAVRAYDDKVLSEYELQLFAWLAVFATLTALMLYDFLSSALMVGMSVLPPAFFLLTYSAATRFRQHHQPLAELLILRVFRSDRTAERLLEDIAHWWCFLGPVNMIAGPDLANAYVAPRHLLRFMMRDLRGAFIPNSTAVQFAIANLDSRPDPDHRYRVNDLLCSPDAWEEAALQLIGNSDAILFDLRGLTQGRRGALWEIDVIVAAGVGKRVLAIVDHKTDLQLLHRSPVLMPNRTYPFEVISADKNLTGRRVFRRLVEIAAGEPVTRGSS